jgi:hypothetical protein
MMTLVIFPPPMNEDDRRGLFLYGLDPLLATCWYVATFISVLRIVLFMQGVSQILVLHMKLILHWNLHSEQRT